ncbi:MAG: hypothetical protein IRZ02_08545 [Acidothermus sp.]|nr:hypothetical protein [Acidothermus sp.]MCL6538114.1 GNAT family N-acetyltransferase [Acidothermus sp.]
MSDSVAALVPVEVIRTLRWRVLRPTQPREAAVYPGDDGPETFHVAVLARDADAVPAPDADALLAGDADAVLAGDADAVLACASFYLEPTPDGRPGWRLRGMAAAVPRRGHGTAALLFGWEEVRRRGGALVWCNARLTAVPFYQRHGFVVTSGEFDVPPLGLHVRMEKTLP